MPEPNQYEIREVMREVARVTVNEMFDRIGLGSPTEIREFRESMLYLADVRRRGAVVRETVTKSVVDKLLGAIGLAIVAGGSAMFAVYMSTKGVHP